MYFVTCALLNWASLLEQSGHKQAYLRLRTLVWLGRAYSLPGVASFSSNVTVDVDDTDIFF